MKNIATAFVAAQKEFAPALKTSTNPHFKSKYADLSAVVEAVIDALNNNGIGMIQQTHETNTGVCVETLLIHESGETLSGGKLQVPAAKQDPQGYGSALTYARRYSLMATCGIAPEDDDGNAATEANKKAHGLRLAQEFAAALNAIDTAADMNALKQAYQVAYGRFTDPKDRATIEQHKNGRKTTLTHTEAA